MLVDLRAKRLAFLAELPLALHQRGAKLLSALFRLLTQGSQPFHLDML